MFIRWQHRKKTRPMFMGRGRTHDGGDVRWTAILVESVRVDGKPRQKHIAYLESYFESDIDIVGEHCEFWDKISAHLDRLNNRISAGDRKKIEADIARKIRRPTKRECEADKRRSAKLRETLVASFKRL
jgi:hypothetical protein